MNEELADLAVVIMAGGAGTRFWPVSTEKRPKQFLRLLGERSLLQQSYDRIASEVAASRILVLTSRAFVEEVREQLPDLPAGNIIGEPCRRDTAAAVTLAALLCRHRLGAQVMAILTADHRIEPTSVFRDTILAAVAGAKRHPSALYTLGIRPTYPATGYGYLCLGDKLDESCAIRSYRIKGFREKPNLATATEYLESGEYLWNSGMFVWSIDAIVAELHQHLPDHLRSLEQAMAADGTDEFDRALATAFEPLHATSIDFAVMERATHVHCVAAPFEWSDVGGWVALDQFLERDSNENAYRAQIHTMAAEHNLVFCEDGAEHVALLGVRDLVVVRAGKRTLVMHRSHAEEIKQLVKSLDKELR